jgi:DNA-binding MarR family transcriptional regulator
MKMRQHSCGRLKGILFEHRSISRKDIIELSKLNGRTVTRCMESFAEQGLVEISHQIIGRGQPQIVYTLRQENIFFLILSIIPGELYAILCDNRGFPISMDRYALENPGQKKDLSQLLFSAVSKVVAEPVLQGKNIYAAAVNFSFDQALPLNYRNHISMYCQDFVHTKYFARMPMNFCFRNLPSIIIWVAKFWV